MRVETYIVNKLREFSVTDTFGIPGGVILKLLQEMQIQSSEITPHLCYHEQAAGFAACGYAQAKGTLGVAYATRGPGILNMMTCIGEAYQESLPVLFITAHGKRTRSAARFEQNQELDIVSGVVGFTKYAANVEKIEDVQNKLEVACMMATTGRKGPVLLDFSATLWGTEMPNIQQSSYHTECNEVNAQVRQIVNRLGKVKRPILLIGDGLRHGIGKQKLYDTVKHIGIPVLSSRGSQDLLSGSPYYYGYIGSHGIRYSNFILSKSDFIISLGNRMAFPIHSESFSPILKQAEIIRIDIDKNELERPFPNAENYSLDAGSVLVELSRLINGHNGWDEWISVCKELKQVLEHEDCTKPVKLLEKYINNQNINAMYVCDVGNNEFWFSRAFEKVGKKGNLFCSKSFGTLGAAIAKAIGVYYATGNEVVCVVGDQGIQYNIQELQYVTKHKIPVKIVVLNNRCSGMIDDHESRVLVGNKIHVNDKTGYYALDLKKIAQAYDLNYFMFTDVDSHEPQAPYICEMEIESLVLTPNLPKGNPCHDMEPLMPRHLYEYLNQL